MKRGKPGEAALTRDTVRSEVAKRYATRFHMTLIIAGSIATGALVTSSLMGAGVGALWLRWLPALASAYLAFFAGVWLWLHLSAYGRHLREAKRREGSSFVDAGADVLDGLANIPLPRGGGSVAREVLRTGGGTFDGGGASASWVADSASSFVSSPSSGLGDGLGEVAGEAVGGLASDEGGFALVVAVALLVAVLAVFFGAAAYVVWQAPAILGEVVFEVLLGSPLVKGVQAVEAGNWAGALLSHTWKPFGLVVAFALVFAAFAGAVAPQARTAAQVIEVLSAKAAD
ncbi:MAG: hypothetical protein NDI88_12640 [Lysobacter sp.]|nr:hypothetical protein [Lysobacter sp.]